MFNFFIESKNLKGPADVNKLQACYDGAISERVMNKFSFFDNSQTAQFNTAHTITSIYHGGIGDLTIYSTHASLSKNLQHSVEYRMKQLKGWKMTDTTETFRQNIETFIIFFFQLSSIDSLNFSIRV